MRYMVEKWSILIIYIAIVNFNILMVVVVKNTDCDKNIYEFAKLLYVETLNITLIFIVFHYFQSLNCCLQD
jgi:hypothetical protein